jgi:hypothetical protein
MINSKNEHYVYENLHDIKNIQNPLGVLSETLDDVGNYRLNSNTNLINIPYSAYDKLENYTKFVENLFFNELNYNLLNISQSDITISGPRGYEIKNIDYLENLNKNNIDLLSNVNIVFGNKKN